MISTYYDEVKDGEFPKGCPAIFREPLNPQGKFSFESFRLLRQAIYYFECELKNGNFWNPPFRLLPDGEWSDWQPTFVVAVGGGGKGKTRSVWQCMRWDPQEYDFECIRAVDLATIIPAKAKRNEQGEGSLDEWMAALVERDILFIDDLGQCPLKGRVVVELWNLIDQRYANKKRTIITTNARSDTDLIEAINPEDENRIKTMLRRIRESCVLVDFDSDRAFVFKNDVTHEMVLPALSDMDEVEAHELTPPSEDVPF